MRSFTGSSHIRSGRETYHVTGPVPKRHVGKKRGVQRSYHHTTFREVLALVREMATRDATIGDLTRATGYLKGYDLSAFGEVQERFAYANHLQSGDLHRARLGGSQQTPNRAANVTRSGNCTRRLSCRYPETESEDPVVRP
jgi:hypothetical protein